MLGDVNICAGALALIVTVLPDDCGEYQEVAFLWVHAWPELNRFLFRISFESFFVVHAPARPCSRGVHPQRGTNPPLCVERGGCCGLCCCCSASIQRASNARPCFSTVVLCLIVSSRLSGKLSCCSYSLTDKRVCPNAKGTPQHFGRVWFSVQDYKQWTLFFYN